MTNEQTLLEEARETPPTNFLRDGGGIRGLITIEVLAEIERATAEAW
jgi:hypothetical protein